MMGTYARTLTLVSLAALGLLLAGPPATADPAAKPMVVKIHADWCGTCQHLNATFEALEKELGGEARLVVLDVTDRESTARSRAEAETLGNVAFFDRYKGQTGTVGVLDASGTPVEVLTGEMRTEPYVSAVAKAKGHPAS